MDPPLLRTTIVLPHRRGDRTTIPGMFDRTRPAMVPHCERTAEQKVREPLGRNRVDGSSGYPASSAAEAETKPTETRPSSVSSAQKTAHKNSKEALDQIVVDLVDGLKLCEHGEDGGGRTKPSPTDGICTEKAVETKKRTAGTKTGDVMKRSATEETSKETTATTSIAPPKKHSKSRLRAILRKKQHQGENDGRASNVSKESGSSRSAVGALRRYLFSYASKKRGQDGQGGGSKRDGAAERLNPYALDGNEAIADSPPCDGGANILATPTPTLATMEPDSTHTTPSMRTVSSIESSAHSGPLHCSLHSISEGDVFHGDGLTKLPTLSPNSPVRSESTALTRSMSSSISTLDSPCDMNLSLPYLMLHENRDMETSSVCSSIGTTYSIKLSSKIINEGLATKRDPPKDEDDPTLVINLPWSDGGDPARGIHGKYSGPVNGSVQPHGKGTLVAKVGEEHLTFHGRWRDNMLISPLESVAKPCREGQTSSTNSSTANDTESLIRATVGTSGKLDGHRQRQSQNYRLGEACRSPSDMIIHRSNTKAIESAAQLMKWDKAFVKRSNGLWTAAILIERGLQPVNDGHGRWRRAEDIDPRSTLEESMLFTIDEDGGAKLIRMKAWGKYIRLIKA